MKSRGATVVYRVRSMLPGSEAVVCAPGERNFLRTRRFELVACGDLQPRQALADSLERAADILQAYFPHVGIKLVTVRLVPPGARVFEVESHESGWMQLRFAMTLRDDGIVGNQQNDRAVIRRLVHEYTHIANKPQVKSQRRQMSKWLDEYRASTAATCVEYQVFGSTVGYGSVEDILAPVGDYANKFPDFVLLSLRARAQATADLQKFFGEVGDGSGGPITRDNGGHALAQYCRGMFAGSGGWDGSEQQPIRRETIEKLLSE